MKLIWNVADHGGELHDPLNGPPTNWVHRVEEVGRTVRRERTHTGSTDAQKISRAGATPGCAALEPPQTRFVPTVTPGVAPALEELPSVMRSSSDENLESLDGNAVKSGARNHGILIHSPKN